ncbi:MAG: hypothetical protein NC217_01510 [Muribaculaceae bacterium]|nr:hypothetical protein [Muribaculaceae bacterium]
MQITLDTLRKRHSVRSFDGGCDADQIKHLRAVITDINTHGVGMNFQLITNNPEVFNSFSKSYGMFKGVTDYVACVVDTSYSNYLERAGYYGMQVVANAVAMGLGTCFVSGTYDKAKVDARVRVGQQLVMLIAIGKMPEVEKPGLIAKMTHALQHRHKGLTPMDFLDTELSWEQVCIAFPKIYDALEAVATAPSAYNKQPVGILVKRVNNPYNPVTDRTGNSSKRQQHEQEMSARYEALMQQDTVSGNSDTQADYILQAYVPAKNQAQLIDLGIAMYAFQVTYPGVWDWGNPATFLPD